MDAAFNADFHHRVRLVYEEYVGVRNDGVTGTRRDISRALEAAKVLYHLRERIPAPYSKSWEDIARQCPDYGLLRDVVDAEKHGQLKDRTRAVNNASQIEERVVITEYKDAAGPYHHVEKAVFLKLTNGTTRELLDVLTNVINFWQAELHAAGLIEKLDPYHPHAKPQPIPRAECNQGRLDMRLARGFDYTQLYQLQHYNYTSGQIEPTDISGAGFEFSVYPVVFDVEIKLVNNTTRQTVSRTVSLSFEQYQKALSLEPDAVRNAYFMTLPQVRAAFGEVAQEIMQLQSSDGQPDGAVQVTVGVDQAAPQPTRRPFWKSLGAWWWRICAAVLPRLGSK